MICDFCLTDTVTWQGPVGRFTHTECSNCHRMNCERHEATPETEDDGFVTVHQTKPKGEQ